MVCARASSSRVEGPEKGAVGVVHGYPGHGFFHVVQRVRSTNPSINHITLENMARACVSYVAFGQMLRPPVTSKWMGIDAYDVCLGHCDFKIFKPEPRFPLNLIFHPFYNRKERGTKKKKKMRIDVRTICYWFS